MHKTLLILFSIILFFSHPSSLFAGSSEDYSVPKYVVNIAGKTITGSGQEILNCIGEAVVGQGYSEDYSAQFGFFNEYFLLQPTPTVTPTVTVTCTPIRTFGSEILHKDWVFARPNPIRGPKGLIEFHLGEGAEVEMKIFTTSNKLILSKHWSTLPAGKNEWAWHAANMANGVYLVYLKAKGHSGKTTVIKKKIVLIK